MRNNALVFILPKIKLALIGLLLAGCQSAPINEGGVTMAPEAIPSVGFSQPLFDEDRYQKALSQMENAQYTSAVSTLYRLAKSFPNEAKVSLNLAISYYELNELEKAKKWVDTTLAIDPNMAAAHNLGGLLAVKSHAFSEAAQHYRQAIRANKQFALAHYNLALLMDKYFQNIPEAYTHYLSYLELRPDDTETRQWVDQLKYSLEP